MERTGIPEYWIVNLVERSIEVHRDPRDGHYRSVRSYTGDEEVRPLAVPEVALRPSTLFESRE
ncbi:MAG: Uma2 family endonuclease [Thermoguttaceae bacterium]|jgi:Uma2 family endonuclease|nr:Uma2 family endonuclease [Thermoguttaceae bacterium]